MKQHRSGFTLLESCAAAVVLMAALTTVVPVLISLARQRQEASRHAQAVILADNLLERITAEPYDSITDLFAGEIAKRANLAESLPQGQTTVQVTPEVGPPAGKRIQVDVVWQTTQSTPSSKIQVATWVYPRAKK